MLLVTFDKLELRSAKLRWCWNSFWHEVVQSSLEVDLKFSSYRLEEDGL